MKVQNKIFVLIALLLSQLFSIKADAQKPNVIIILTDDQGWGDIGFNGNPYLHTPTIDSFAFSAASFSNFFVNPICAPTRASLLTGRYNLSAGVIGVSNGWERMRSSEYTLGELFSDNGYATGCFGKWHNGEHYPEDPNGQGFKEFFGFAAGHWNVYFDPTLQHNQEMKPTKGFITDIITDSAISFIQRNENQPFFCYIPYNAPHEPFLVPDYYWKKFSAIGLDTATSVVYGMCENLDENIARLIAVLRQLHLEENTILWLMSDNGPALKSKRYNGNLKGGKGSIDEGGSKVFSFLKWSTKINSTVINMPTGAIDVFPTLQNLCQLSSNSNKKADGIDLSGFLIRHASESSYRTLFLNHSINTLSPFPGALRTERYRLQLYKNHTELYDMYKDSGQNNNIFMQQPLLADSLKKTYFNWYYQQAKGPFAKRPIPVGYASVPVCRLMATEASFCGQIRFAFEDGYAHDYLTGWSSLHDSISWQVNVHDEGFYNITIRYASKNGQQGSVVRVKVGNHQLITTISQSFDEPPYPARDIIPPVGAPEKPWGRLTAGRIYLKKGIQKIVLSPLKISGKEVSDLYSIELKKGK
jgi:arylsulfatase A-like enzyme